MSTELKSPSEVNTPAPSTDREPLLHMARHNIEQSEVELIDLEADVVKVPAANYFDETRFKDEIEKIFRRVPLMVAVTAEIPNPGDYKTMDAAGMPVLIVRGSDGEVRTFINSCSHRGTNVAIEEYGNTKRFVCPYHAWTFDQKGKLIAVASKHEFGDVDPECYSLIPLPTTERGGLIWTIVNPKSTVDFDTFFAGYDKLLGQFGFKDWILFESRTIRGPNWKIAYDGYMDLYHLPVLHRNTFGPDMSNQALYYVWGPHQRVMSPSRHMKKLEGLSDDQWPMDILMAGVWTIFPHISIASFDGGGRGVMVSQLFPGETPGESYTTQYYLMESEPNEQQKLDAQAQFKLLEFVVQDEDYATGLRQQKALEAGGRDHVLFGRNEGGGQRFHRWVEKLLNTEEEDLNKAFQEGV